VRKSLLVGGVVFLIIGLAFLFIPTVQPVGDEEASPSVPDVFFEPGLTPGSLTFTVLWYSQSSVTVTAYSCGSDTSCSGGSQYANTAHQVGQESSEDGSFSFAGSPGTGYEVYASSSTYLDVSYNGPLLGGFLGLGWAIFGVLLVILGAVLKPSKARAPRGVAVGALAAAPPPPPPSPGAGVGGAPSTAAGLAGFTSSPVAPPPSPPGDTPPKFAYSRGK
jgi:hypothetical protein